MFLSSAEDSRRKSFLIRDILAVNRQYYQQNVLHLILSAQKLNLDSFYQSIDSIESQKSLDIAASSTIKSSNCLSSNDTNQITSKDWINRSTFRIRMQKRK